MAARISLQDTLETSEVVSLCAANGWSAATRPEQFLPALRQSNALATRGHDGVHVDPRGARSWRLSP